MAFLSCVLVFSTEDRYMFNYHHVRSCISRGRGRLVAAVIVMALALGPTGCAKGNPFIIDLMPAPDIYTDGTVDLFSGQSADMDAPVSAILYATDRKPDEEGELFYLNERGFNLRLGLAEIALGKEGYTWEEARRVSLLKNRTDKYPLKVVAVDELGILDRTLTVFTPRETTPEQPHAAAQRFAATVNARLAETHKKDIFIYVHGYKVVFNNPLLVAAELWHFLGYEGVFIAYAWPSTPNKWAYFSDLETSELSAHNLRAFLQYLAEETDAKRIHIIGYSAGTRLVVGALHQLALLNATADEQAVQERFRIGEVILIGSDIDRQLFGAYLVDDLLKVSETTTIYVSGNDKALGFSTWMFRRERLGQTQVEFLNPRVTEYLQNTPKLQLVDVTEVEGSAKGNGHGYFRSSPWVSSDILMTLMHDLVPANRGLVRHSDHPMWTFPDNYIELLRAALQARTPAPQ